MESANETRFPGGGKRMTVAGVKVIEGDCRKHMARMTAPVPGEAFGLIDAVITDPPYHLQSIVKRFQKTDKADDTKTSARARSRADSYGRLNAGFMGQSWDGGDVAFDPETWRLAFDVLKPGAHLLAFGSPRNYHRLAVAIEDAGFEIRNCLLWMFGTGMPKSRRVELDIEDCSAREQWAGWGTGLKPAYEPICMARKPIEESTVAANVLKYGTGAINIGACRVESEKLTGWGGKAGGGGTWNKSNSGFCKDGQPRPVDGRWPANVAHDGSEEVLAAFAQFGESKSTGGGMKDLRKGKLFQGETQPNITNTSGLGDTGTASRFFYSAKAGPDDRAGSKHPTVKPVALMRWLVRMVTPPGGTILDPFAGTGTTGIAAMREGVNAVLIEAEPKYAEDIRKRLDALDGSDTPLFAEVET